MAVTASPKAQRPTDAPSYFGSRVGFYDSRYDTCDADGHALRARLEATLQLAGNGPGDSLDAGMGPGRLCVALEQRGWTICGVDASDVMVEVARERLPTAHERLLVGRIEELPFPDGSFDLVTATGVLEYATVASALAELARVLKPGGRAVVSYPNPEAYYGIWKTRVWYPAVRAVKRLLCRANPGLPRGAGAILPATFGTMLRDAGLIQRACVYTSFSPLPTPLDQLLPRIAERLGARLEGGSGLPARRVATQVVYLAHLERAEHSPPPPLPA
jgi:ubiquinone/menaquinone biosynthesis C-methylase UbiE